MTHNHQIHLAILQQPYLDLILSGEKTIESRFSRVRCKPYRAVQPGAQILLKESGGLVLGEFTVAKVKTYSSLTADIMAAIEQQYGKEICTATDPEFWPTREGCRYATLMWVSKPQRYSSPYPFPKKDMRPWVVLDSASGQQNLFQEK
ncbi:ASCH domain-containing protein [Patescibacteria group bacterium]